MRRSLSWWLFWGGVGTVLYTYIGFPLLLLVRGFLFPRQVRRGTNLPSVSLIIAAYNEADYIVKKLDNAHAVDYPRDKLEIIVASDGSNDGTNELVTAYNSAQVRLLALPRQGKNRTLNTAVAEARNSVLVFTDADSMLKPDALRHLVAPLGDPSVGGVAGDYHYETTSEEGGGERTYWSVDRLLKEMESRAGNVISATGQLYAIRREIFQKVPSGVTDDFYTSVRVVGAHKRLIFEPKAIVTGPVAASDDAEFNRKVRILTRGFNSVWESRHLLNPFEYGFYAVQLFSHKVLRRLMALPLLVTALAAPFLWGRGWIYKVATLTQWGVHSLALLGYLLRGTPLGRKKPLSVPFFFDMVNIAAVIALVNLLRGKRQDIWVTQRAPEQTPR
jgi:cellulose synthase/poly-beta-1,6-N-acetylglucosamine synthase-like glycosyltransferase